MKKYNDVMAAKVAASWTIDLSIVLKKGNSYYVVPFKRAWRYMQYGFQYMYL